MTEQTAYPWEAPPEGPSAELAHRLAALLPRLETARLTLRALRIEDFPAYAEILMSERAVYMDGPYDREMAWIDFSCSVSCWLLRGHGPWTVTARETGEILGFVTVQMEYSDHEPELGYCLRETAEGRGHALEACRAARAHAIETLGLTRLVSYVAPANTRSRALAERLGAWEDAAAAARLPDHAGDPMLVMRHAPAREAAQ